MAHQGNMLVAQPNDASPISRTHVTMKERIDSTKLYYDLHLGAGAHMPPPTSILHTQISEDTQ